MKTYSLWPLSSQCTWKPHQIRTITICLKENATTALRNTDTTFRKPPHGTAAHVPSTSAGTKLASTVRWATGLEAHMLVGCRQRSYFTGPSLLPLKLFHLRNEPKMHVEEQRTFVFTLLMKPFACWFAQGWSLNVSQLVYLCYNGREIYQGRTKMLEVLHGKWEKRCQSS